METHKAFALTLVAVIAFSGIGLLSAKPANAQSMPTPSVPQFSIQVIDHSYDVPTTYYTDPYTGKQVTNPGYHVNDIRVEGNIKNQHFNQYSIPDPNSTSKYLTIDFYYNISYKGHFGTQWMQLYGSEDVDFLKQKYGSENTNFTASRYNTFEFQNGQQVDFQVKAIIGYETWGFVQAWPYRILNGQDSGWSNTLTVTITTDTSSPDAYATTIDNSNYPTLPTLQPSLTPTPTSIIQASPSPASSVPECSALILTPLLAAVLFAAIALKAKSKKVDGI